ncbi:unannotated protein [freshwater metagenome]|uniref:Unannotated protein n=1 Tax=freshwater metagenome TaxID=449393 RepID=A0A6J7A6W9_9ZZZZ
MFDNDVSWTTHRFNPLAKGAGIRNSCGEADELNLFWSQDHDLLPDAPAIGVLDEMNLVKNHDSEPSKK